jgi:hypothetical protein
MKFPPHDLEENRKFSTKLHVERKRRLAPNPSPPRQRTVYNFARTIERLAGYP